MHLIFAWCVRLRFSPLCFIVQAIGAADGEYAQRLFDYAAREPLNDPSFTAHIQHIQRLTGRARL